MTTLAARLVRRRIGRLPEDLRPDCVRILREIVGGEARADCLPALSPPLRQSEVHDLLRDRGFLIKVLPSWRELHARGRKLESGGGVP